MDVVKVFFEKVNGKLILLVDLKEVNVFVGYIEVKDIEGEVVDLGFFGFDIGLKFIVKFDEVLIGVKIVVWNGFMGVFENLDF